MPIVPGTPAPPPVPPGTTACRVLLLAIYEALTIPPPATEKDEVTYLRLARDRDRIALAAIRLVLADKDEDPLDLLVAADSLRQQLADYPPDTYDPSPLSC